MSKRRRYIPIPIRERAKNFHYSQLPLPVDRFKTAKNREHIKANQNIFRETSAALFDYSVTADEVQDIWAAWEYALGEIIHEQSGKSLRIPFMGTFEPRYKTTTGVKDAFPEILRPFFASGQQVDFADWALRSDAFREIEAEALEDLKHHGKVSLQDILLLFAKKVQEQKLNDINGTADI